MRFMLLLLLGACGANSAAPSRPAPTCDHVIGPMVERRVSASVAEIATRDHLDVAQARRLDELARARAGQLSATMVASCTADRWSNDALSCFEQARTDD